MFKHYLGLAAPSTGATFAAWAASMSFCFWAASSSLCILPPCLTNFLVKENSPNLCPIISSVTKTGTWTLPLCTPKVNPIISGIIVQSLAQVLMMVLSPALSLPIFFNSFSSTYGPFLSDRLMLGVGSLAREGVAIRELCYLVLLIMNLPDFLFLFLVFL